MKTSPFAIVGHPYSHPMCMLNSLGRDHGKTLLSHLFGDQAVGTISHLDGVALTVNEEKDGPTLVEVVNLETTDGLAILNE